MDPMPGYELTELWMSEDGMPQRGLWNTVYVTDKGKANMKLRKSMLYLLHIREEDLVEEDLRTRSNSMSDVQVGMRFIKANASIFLNYMAFTEQNSTSSGKKGDGDKKNKK